MTALTLDEILRVLPHRYPFLLVDAVLELERGVRIVATKNVSANEPWFGGHFPERPMMPGLLITEALAQAGAILLLTEQPAGSDRLVYFASLDDVHWHETVRAGDQIRLEIVVAQRRGRLNKVQGRALVGDVLVCEATMGAMVVDR